jgi:flagellar biosynthesis/type III secretory pathway protein FliH
VDLKKITKNIQKLANENYELGYETGIENSYQDGYEEGVNDGVLAERERIENVIKMKIVWAMEEGKGTQIVFWKNALEILIDLPRHMANALTEEGLREELEEFGF